MSDTKFESKSLASYLEHSYRDYAMYVLLDRALPFIGDGLKPVQRRILYAMSQLNLNHGNKYKKSARVVGDVIGKYHPHGDAATYEAMVVMSQTFSSRYNLVDGQGNWGALDEPKSYAAMRYTEARLDRNAQMLLAELKAGGLQMQQNFDASTTEPLWLPAQIPYALINGSTGIAVGMTTSIPAHNLTEVIDACIALLQNPQLQLEQILEHIKGPDFATGCTVSVQRDDLHRMYEQGQGKVHMRAVWQSEKNDIVITKLPYQVGTTKIIESLTQLVDNKSLPMVQQLRDESDDVNPVRLVISCKKGVDHSQLMGHLYASSSLEETFRVQLNLVSVERKPKQYGLKQLLQEWLMFREHYVLARTNHRLEKVAERLQVLKGYLAAYLQIERVIAIVKDHEKPKQQLMDELKVNQVQAEAILELKIRQLGKLQHQQIVKELTELEKEQTSLSAILASKTKLRNLLIKELKRVKKEFADERRSQLEYNFTPSQQITELELAPTEDATLILSQMGWVRLAKSLDKPAQQMNFREGDAYLSHSTGKTNNIALIFGQQGRAYSILASRLPPARGHGQPLSGFFQIPPECKVVGGLLAKPDSSILVASQAGKGLITKVVDCQSKNRKGKGVLKVTGKTQTIHPTLISNTDSSIDSSLVCCLTSIGKLLVFPIQDELYQTSGVGKTLINLTLNKTDLQQIKRKKNNIVEGKSWLKAVHVISEKEVLVVQNGKRISNFSYSELASEQWLSEKGAKGEFITNTFRNFDRSWVVHG